MDATAQFFRQEARAWEIAAHAQGVREPGAAGREG